MRKNHDTAGICRPSLAVFPAGPCSALRRNAQRRGRAGEDHPTETNKCDSDLRPVVAQTVRPINLALGCASDWETELGNDEPVPLFVPSPFAWRLLKIGSFSQEVRGHPFQALGKKSIVAVFGQPCAHTRLTPKIRCEQHAPPP